jgi:hypothetical protein
MTCDDKQQAAVVNDSTSSTDQANQQQTAAIVNEGASFSTLAITKPQAGLVINEATASNARTSRNPSPNYR